MNILVAKINFLTLAASPILRIINCIIMWFILTVRTLSMIYSMDEAVDAFPCQQTDQHMCQCCRKIIPSLCTRFPLAGLAEMIEMAEPSIVLLLEQSEQGWRESEQGWRELEQ